MAITDKDLEKISAHLEKTRKETKRTGQRIWETLKSIGGIGALVTLVVFVVSYTTKIDRLREDFNAAKQLIDKEVVLRKTYYNDLFIAKRDSTNSHYKTKLEYNTVTDTLFYP